MKYFAIIIAALALSGCVVDTYVKNKDVEIFRRGALFYDATADSVDVTADTNGLRHVTLNKYQGTASTNLNDIIGTAVGAAVKAALGKQP